MNFYIRITQGGRIESQRTLVLNPALPGEYDTWIHHQSTRCGAFRNQAEDRPVLGKVTQERCEPGSCWDRGQQRVQWPPGQSKAGANSDLKTEASWRKSSPILILIQSRPRIKDRRHEPGTTLRPSPEPVAAVTWDPVLCGPEHLNNSVWLHHSSVCWNTVNHCNF